MLRTIEERNELVVKNLRLVPHALKPFLERADVKRFGVNDALQEGYASLTKAAGKWDPVRGAFSTFATFVIRRDVIREVSKGHRSVAVTSVAWNGFSQDPTVPQPHARPYDPDVILDVRSLLARLGPTNRRIAEERYLKGRDPADIAREWGRSPEAVHVRLRSVVRALFRGHAPHKVRVPRVRGRAAPRRGAREADRIRTLRAAGRTWVEVAEEFGCNARTLKNWFNRHLIRERTRRSLS